MAHSPQTFMQNGERSLREARESAARGGCRGSSPLLGARGQRPRLLVAKSVLGHS